MKRLFLLVVTGFLFSAFAAGAAFGQSGFEVSGTITDGQTGETIPGANVAVAGTQIGSVSNGTGEYTVEAPSAQDTLVFSFVGYETQRVPIQGRSQVDVALQIGAVQADEVVVVGYTTQRDETVTGAVSSISAEELADRKLGTIEEALKGRLPGVSIETTGNPGAGASIRIRGRSFALGNGPLYVVDGVYTGSNPNLNPDDVASIEVLKDASATAQYGSQAANGVVVITTKKGTAGDSPNVSVGAYYGAQNIPNRIELADAQEWGELAREAYANAGESAPPNVANPANFADTDWQDAIFQTGTIQQYNASVSGGSESASYLISGEYFDQEGTVIGTPYQRISARVNSEITRGRFTFGENATFVRSRKDNITGLPVNISIQQIPTLPVVDEGTVGGYGLGRDGLNETLTPNPVAEQRLSDNMNYYNRLLSGLYGEVDLWEGLSYRLNLGLEYTDLKNENFRSLGRIRQNDPLDPNFLDVTENTTYNLQVENLLRIDDTFGDHAVNGVLGYREDRTDGDNLFVHRENFADESLREIDAGGAEGAETNGSSSTTARRSFLARANYEYDGRYLATGTFRRDGSSVFGRDRRWGNFFAGSLGWVLSEESFYESIPFFNDNVNFLKARVSYGEIGNDAVGAYDQFAVLALNRGYTFGPNARLAPGAIQNSLADPTIQWQENQQFNAGIDLELFESALSLTTNYYVSTSDKLLARPTLPLSTGVTALPITNAGSIRNRGFELGLDYRHDTGGDFSFNTNLNLTTINNEVLSIGVGNQPLFNGAFGVSRTAIGAPTGSLYVLETNGLFQNQEEVLNHTSMVDTDGDGEPDTEQIIQGDAQPGDVRFVDRNGDGVINDEDRYNAGSSYPDLEGGLSFDAQYKGFDTSLSLKGSYGAELFNVPRILTAVGGNNGYRAGVNPWTPEDPNTDTPRALWNTDPQAVANNRGNSDRWIEDASYLRIQSVELGYTVPSSLMQNLAGVSDMRVRLYVNSQNLYTFTGYSSWDPATPGQGVLSSAVDDGTIYPAGRTISFGVDVDL